MAQRTALVTGAAGGIGQAVVRALTGSGSRVAAMDHDADLLRKAFPDGLPDADVVTVTGDVADPSAAERAVAEAERHLGPLDALVNVAGVLRTGDVESCADEDWHLGLRVDVRRHDADYDVAGYSVVVMGPGPGDPRTSGDPKIASMRGAIRRLLTEHRPFLAVCLSHQLLCAEMGLPLIRRGTPHQGVQRTIDLFGEHRRVGFYNTFAARLRGSGLPQWSGGRLTVSSDRETGEIHGLRGSGFASVQFHPESLLTEDGPSILAGMLASLDRQSALA